MPIGSAFWGPSNAMQEAEGFPREMGNWSFQQFKDWLAQQNAQGWTANELQGRVIPMLQQFAENGSASPEEIRSLGDRLMPGLGQTIASRAERLRGINEQYGQLPTGASVTERTGQNIQDWATDIGRTQDLTQQEIDNLARSNMGAYEGANRDIVGSIQRTASGAQEGANTTYGGLRAGNDALYNRLGTSAENTFGGIGERQAATYGDSRGQVGSTFGGMGTRTTGTQGNLTASAEQANRDAAARGGTTFGRLNTSLENTYDEGVNRGTTTFGGLRNTSERMNQEFGARGEAAYNPLDTSLEETYDEFGNSINAGYGEMRGALEETRPDSKLAAARVARSFDSARANMAERLKQGGISPGSPQYISLMSDIDAAQSRAMDDKLAEGGQQFYQNTANLITGEQGARERQLTGRQSGRERLTLDELGRTDQQQADLEARRAGYDLTELNRSDTEANNRQTSRERLSTAELARTDQQAQELEQAKRDLGLWGAETLNAQDQARLANALGISQAELADYERNALNRQTSRERQGEAQFGNEAALSTEQNRINQAANERADTSYQNEVRRMNEGTVGQNTQRSVDSRGNLDTGYARTVDWRNAGNQQAMLERALQREDWQTASQLAREMNQEDLTALGLDQAMIEAGAAQAARQQAGQQWGISGLAGQEAQARASQTSAANTALNFGRNAGQNYEQAYNYEAPNAGWGARVLGAVGGAAIGAATGNPALGSFVGQTAQSMVPTYGQQGGQGNYYQTGGAEPNPNGGVSTSGGGATGFISRIINPGASVQNVSPSTRWDAYTQAAAQPVQFNTSRSTTPYVAQRPQQQQQQQYQPWQQMWQY